MMNIQDYAYYILLGSNALMAGAAAIAILRFKNQCRRLEAFWTSPIGTALAVREADAPASGSDISVTPAAQVRANLVTQLRLEQSITELQQKVEKIAKRPTRVVTTPNRVDRPLPIDNAVRMARNGASIEQLTKACGLNIGEAKLMQKLHGSAARAASA